MKLAVVGATGLVGTEILEVLAEHNFPYSELLLVASERSVGKQIEYKGKKYPVIGLADAVQPNLKSPSSPQEVIPRWNGHQNLQKLVRM